VPSSIPCVFSYASNYRQFRQTLAPQPRRLTIWLCRAAMAAALASPATMATAATGVASAPSAMCQDDLLLTFAIPQRHRPDPSLNAFSAGPGMGQDVVALAESAGADVPSQATVSPTVVRPRGFTLALAMDEPCNNSSLPQYTLTGAGPLGWNDDRSQAAMLEAADDGAAGPLGSGASGQAWLSPAVFTSTDTSESLIPASASALGTSGVAADDSASGELVGVTTRGADSERADAGFVANSGMDGAAGSLGSGFTGLGSPSGGGGGVGAPDPASPSTSLVNPVTPAALGAAPVAGPVPEPSTWVLMILGTAGVGVMLRRQHATRGQALAPIRVRDDT
jgi:hypothetical protein